MSENIKKTTKAFNAILFITKPIKLVKWLKRFTNSLKTPDILTMTSF